MLHGGESSLLFKHIQGLRGEIEEQKRLIAKEEEVGKRLNEIIQEKSRAINSLREKNQGLEDELKQKQAAIVNHRQVLERLRHNAALVRHQLDYQKEELQKKKSDSELMRQQCQETLHSHQRKYEGYLKMYGKLPGVSDHMKTKKRLDELEATLKNATERYNETRKAKLLERKRMMGVDESNNFSSLETWGVALAQKYIDYKKHIEGKGKLLLEIQKRKENIEELKMKVKKKEQERAEEAERQRIAQLHPISQSKVGQDGKENRMMMNSGEMNRKNRFADFKLMQKSPLQLSAPNLRCELSGKSYKKYMPSFKFEKSSPLMRSQSMSSLVKGSSGTNVKRNEISNPKSLKNWLVSGSKQGGGEAAMQLTHTRPGVQANAKGVEMYTANSTSNDSEMEWTSKTLRQNMIGEKITNPETASPMPVSSSSQACSAFSFGDICMSPEEDFRFAPHVLPEMPFDNRIGKTTATSDASSSVGATQPSSKPLHDQDFKFAVPTAPPPGRLMRRGHSKNVEKHPQPSTADKDIFPSPFSSTPLENESFDAGPSNMPFSFMTSDEEPSGNAFSLFGGNMQDVIDESPSSHGFPMFKDHEDGPSPFGSLFSLK